ncbi:MAG: extracellular solute-binding protein [Candidatus Omnitrophica bacterium]|nr:extracellular solute-binding protein [Candidatus Omnitrophota bacterium]
MRHAVTRQRRFPFLFGLFAVAGVALGRNPAVSAGEQVVVLYVSEDQVFAEPILKDFERDTGITVKAVYDTEEAKSTGVMNRLLAERNNPQADVYWANEPIRAEVLKQRGISAPYVSPNAQGIPQMFKDPEGYWTGFSARARVLVVCADVKDKPTSILAYTDPQWKAQAVMANPLFGTTTAQVAALFTVWGDERAKAFMQGLKANGVKISTSNGESADFVASGEAVFALVDSDDGASRLAQGKSIEVVYPDQGAEDIGCLLVPNAALLIKGAPHAENGRKLIDYLLSKETERKLAFADCAQLPLHPGVETPPTVKRIETLKLMQIHYAEAARILEAIQPFLKAWAEY